MSSSERMKSTGIAAVEELRAVDAVDVAVIVDEKEARRLCIPSTRRRVIAEAGKRHRQNWMLSRDCPAAVDAEDVVAAVSGPSASGIIASDILFCTPAARPPS